MIKKHCLNEGLTQFVTYTTENGIDEGFLILRTQPYLSLNDALESLSLEYNNLLLRKEFTGFAPIYTRFFLSDVENQYEEVCRSDIYNNLSVGSVRMTGKEPLDSAKVSIVSHFLKTDKEHLSRIDGNYPNSLAFRGQNYGMYFYADCGSSESNDPGEQTEITLNKLEKSYSDIEGKKDLIRTWVSVRDIDNNYIPFVVKRKDFFELISMDRYYPASTGVEGRSWDSKRLVVLDALIYSGLGDDQIVKMEAVDNMPSTISYGVTFERGLKVEFGDRTHYHLSGTASIDINGKVIHIGDIHKQVEQALANFKALLNNSGLSFADLMYLVFYVRDAKCTEEIKNIADKILPADIPRVYVRSSICRPQWLMELDGIAIGKGNTRYNPFK